MWLLYHFYSEKNYEALKSKKSMFSIEQNINFIKTRQNGKWKILHTFWEEWTMYFSSFKNCELKVKLWWVGARKRKKCIFVKFILSKGIFFDICSRSHHYAQLGNAPKKTFFAYSALIMNTLKGSSGRFFNFSSQTQNFTVGLTGPNLP